MCRAVLVELAVIIARNAVCEGVAGAMTCDLEHLRSTYTSLFPWQKLIRTRTACWRSWKGRGLASCSRF